MQGVLLQTYHAADDSVHTIQPFDGKLLVVCTSSREEIGNASASGPRVWKTSTELFALQGV